MTSESATVSDITSRSSTETDIKKIVASIEDDLMSNNAQSKIAALEALNMILQKCETYIPVSVLTLLTKASYEPLRTLVFKQLQKLIDKVTEHSIAASEMFPIEDAEMSQTSSVEILSETYLGLPSNYLKKLICDVVIPEMFRLDTEENTRNTLIELGFILIKSFHLTNLMDQEIKAFTCRVIETYSKALEKLRETNHKRWQDLWIFLVRFSAKHLHTAMDLANKLLRVVEYAFRNPSYEQRIKGYDCWKELIDNASLDMNHMCSSKQVKLLITPLRAKFSKMEIVICKRFEVFLYLLEKLQNQSILCLNEFLEFCFGITSSSSNSSKNGQGKLVPALWLKSIQVFLAILGDQTHICSSINRTLFDGPIINENNIGNLHQVIIGSVVESTIILKHISINESEKASLLSSLWEALFDILVKSSSETQEKSFQLIFSSINSVFTEFNEDITYVGLFIAFLQLLESSIDHRLISDSVKLLLENSLKFMQETEVSNKFCQHFCEVIKLCCAENHVIEFLLEQLKKLETTKNESLLCEIWKLIGGTIIKDYQNQPKMVCQLILWPIYRSDKLQGKLMEDIISSWNKFYITLSENSDSLKNMIIRELDKAFKSNPLIGSNIAEFISPLSSSEIKLFDSDYVEAVLKLISNISSLPLLPQESIDKMFPLINKCIEYLNSYCEDISAELINDICQCVDKIPSHQKDTNLRQILETLFDKNSTSSDLIIEKKTRKLLSSFTNTQSQRKSSKASPFSPETTNTQSPGGMKRSMRMTQMAFAKPGSGVTTEKVNALQFFGKDIETMSPLKVKGSVLQNQRNSSPNNSRSKRIISSVKKPEPPSMIEDQTCDFVVIDTEVKLQKDKLTEHQKEELRRRREDIPALYQDLSQSQTQSMSSDTNSKDVGHIISNANIDIVESHPDKKDETDLQHSSDDSSMVSVEYQISNCDQGSTQMIEEVNLLTEDKTEEKDILNNDNNDNVGRNNRKSVGKIEKELMRIQMNIVGGDTFLQNLPSKRKRKPIEKSDIIVRKPTKKESESKNMDNIFKNPEVNSELEIKIERIDLDPKYQTVKVWEPEESEIECQGSEITPVIILNDLEKKVDDSISKTPEAPNNNRKNKFIKPKKFIDSPKSSRKKSTNETEEKKSSKKKMNDSTTPLKSKTLFASPQTPKLHSTISQNEILSDTTEKVVVENAKLENYNSQSQSMFSEDIVIQTTGDVKQSKEKNSDQTNSEKIKKRPKEIMKKNKEKVKTIQSQLKLANLNNLSNNAGQKGAKNAKLIFIREITNSKTVQETNVAAAGLKRSKDKKSKGISYTIETPSSRIDLLPLDSDMKGMDAQISSNESKTNVESEKPKKRKRTKSENGSTSSSSPKNSKNSLSREKEKTKKISSKKSRKEHSDESPSSSIDEKELFTIEVKLKKPDSRKRTSNSHIRDNVISICSSSGEDTPDLKAKKKTRKSAALIKNTEPIIKETPTPQTEILDAPEEPMIISADSTKSKKSEILDSTKSKKSEILTQNFDLFENNSDLLTSQNIIDMKVTTEKAVLVDEVLKNEQSIEKSSGPMTAKKSRSMSSLSVQSDEKDEIQESNNELKPSSRKSSPSKTPVCVSPSRITRSRSCSLSPNIPSQKNKEPITKGVKSLFAESEDVIESSQDSLSENASIAVGNQSKIKKFRPRILSPRVSITILPEGSGASAKKDTESEIPVSQADTETCDSNVESAPVDVAALNLDLPSKPELTESEKILSMADTVSIVSQVSDEKLQENRTELDSIDNVIMNNVEIEEAVNNADVVESRNDELIIVSEDLRCASPTNIIEVEVVGTPEKLPNSELPGSPVNNETPTLKRELLDNTLDISPICSQVETKKESDEEKAILEAIEKLSENIEEESKQKKQCDNIDDNNKPTKSVISVNLRSNKLLNMVNVESPVSCKGFEKKVISSPAGMRSRYGRLFPFFIRNNEVDTRNGNSLAGNENADDILTFSRQVPSPLAIPSSGILKRKLADTDDNYSPCAKRKRVNFSYPCISSTKLYIRHKEELNSHFRPSYKNLFGDDIEEEDEDIYLTAEEQMETEESMDIGASYLCQRKPIYEQLIDCKDNLDVLWKRLSSPVYGETLKRVLKDRNIETVGDIAKLSETDINRLPFKQPRVKTVRKALNYYFNNVFKKENNGDECEVDRSETETISSDIELTEEKTPEENTTNEKIVISEESETPDIIRSNPSEVIREEFTGVLRKMRDEKLPLEEFGDIFMDLVEESDVINVLKAVYNTDFRKFFEKEHWRYLIETIVQCGGTTEMFDIISDLAENNETFSDQLEHIVQLRIEQNPLKNIIRKRSLNDVKNALEDCISNDHFKREEVLKTCYLPLVKSPSDIKTYFDTLTVVQVNEFFVERVQASDLAVFMEQIRESYGRYTVAQCADKKDVLKICSKEDLTTSLIERGDVVETMKHLISFINDEEKLIELYAHLGSLISLPSRVRATIELMESVHVEISSIK